MTPRHLFSECESVSAALIVTYTVGASVDYVFCVAEAGKNTMDFYDAMVYAWNVQVFEFVLTGAALLSQCRTVWYVLLKMRWCSIQTEHRLSSYIHNNREAWNLLLMDTEHNQTNNFTSFDKQRL